MRTPSAWHGKQARSGLAGLSRIAPLDQRTALADQCLHSAEADVRHPRRKSGFDPIPNSLSWSRIVPVSEVCTECSPVA